MYPATENSRLAALATLLKVFARWAPQARHDLVGACSPISLEIALLGVKSRRAPLSTEDIDHFIRRGKENVKNTVDEINRVILLQSQNRQQSIGVSEMMDKMARTARTLFAGVNWSHPPDADSLGVDSEYDLTMVIWAALMSLYDRHGPNMQLRMEARREENALTLRFSVSPSPDGHCHRVDTESVTCDRIATEEVHHLAEHLGFAFTSDEDVIELRRTNRI